MKPEPKDSATFVLHLLNERGSRGITRMEALMAGCGNLPARVGELRHDFGIDVSDRWEKTPKGARIKRYFLAEGERS